MILDEILPDLRDEYRQLDQILRGLSEAQWQAGSDAGGWTVCDVIVHLALTEERVVTTLAEASTEWTSLDRSVDELMNDDVRQNQSAPAYVLTRWRDATTRSLTALAEADPDMTVSWAAAPLRPATLATTRLAEHWAHALDVAVPLRLDYPDTSRLRHIAWLAHATLPYACSLHGLEPQAVRVELVGPNAERWIYGPDDASSVIAGDAGAFCRVGARRLAPSDSGLFTSGPFADQALNVLRNYAA
ncbi:MAG: maleylpyruvate isomerase family mycothiol-dependent enzyme [Actinomycetia bacterium]|nr:maleylpyruvate isomerase family mycothiol-dependent enzyme [Actinomycetes bacterium]